MKRKTNARRFEEIRAKLKLAELAVAEMAIEFDINGVIEDEDYRKPLGQLERMTFGIAEFALNQVMDVDALVDEFTLSAEEIVNETETPEVAFEAMVEKMLK